MSDLALLGGEPVRRAPFPDWPFYGEEEERSVLATLRTQKLCCAAGGQTVHRFEEAFAAWCGAPGAVATTTGTSALHAAFAAAGLGPGDEVIVPAYTFISTASAALMLGAIPVFADVVRDTLNIDPESVRERLTDRTKAIALVHANGLPVDMDPINRIAGERGILVIEDCSHAHGAGYRGKSAGVLGDIAAFSFQMKKILPIGEGGMVVSREQKFLDRAWDFVNLAKGGKTGQLGYNLRMHELQGALGLAFLPKVHGHNEIRRRNAQTLRKAVADLPGIRPAPAAPPADAREVYYNFIFDFDARGAGIDRAAFLEAVQAEGVPLQRNGYVPLHTIALFEEMRERPYRLPENAPILKGRKLYGKGVCPVAEAAMAEGNIELKIHPPRGDQEMADVAAAIRKVLTHAGDLRARQEKTAAK
jgi:dTDP-4-amino-4,6-dideoxygalactose transaminase